MIECSSYQIDLAPSLAPTVGLLINITPDHLDRHGDLAGYAAVKERLVAKAGHRARRRRRRAEPGDRGASRGRAGPRALSGCRAAQRRSPTSSSPAIASSRAGAAELRIDLRRRSRSARRPQRPERRLRLCGGDARSASGATTSRAPSTTFPGLAHRMEEVGRRGRVCSSSTIRRRPTPTPPRRRCSRFATSTGFSAGKAEGGRHRAAASALSARRQGLPDRRGRGGFRRDAGGRGSLRALRDARRARSRPRRATRSLRAPRSRSCSCRRPAPRSTSSPISRRAATPSAPQSMIFLNGEP